MSAQADQAHELIPQPVGMPDALRAALTAVLPGRLAEMRRTNDQAFAKAVEWQSLSPVRSWVLAWARDIGIARRAGLSARHGHAISDLEHEDPQIGQGALRELTEILDEALRAVRT
jgi:hypothetical protein